MTMFFLLIILGSTDKRAPQGFAPIAIGLGLTLIHLISIPVTNTSVNPARSTGVGAVRRRLGGPTAVAILARAHRRGTSRRIRLSHHLGPGRLRAKRHEADMKVLVKSAWGSDDPTKAAFPFLHANALAEAGHDAQIFLLGEAVSLMRDPVANAVVPVGWPPVAETLRATVALGIPIHV